MATITVMAVATLLQLLAVDANSMLVTSNDPNLYFSEQNWAKTQDGGMVSVNPGAYFKLNFTGSAPIAVSLANMSAPGDPGDHFMNIGKLHLFVGYG